MLKLYSTDVAKPQEEFSPVNDGEMSLRRCLFPGLIQRVVLKCS